MLAIVSYLAAAWSVIAAIGLAGLTLAVHATALGVGLSDLLGASRGGFATPTPRPAAPPSAGSVFLLAGIVLVRAARTGGPAAPGGREALRHAQTARLVGRRCRPWEPSWWTTRARWPTAWPGGSRRWC